MRLYLKYLVHKISYCEQQYREMTNKRDIYSPLSKYATIVSQQLYDPFFHWSDIDKNKEKSRTDSLDKIIIEHSTAQLNALSWFYELERTFTRCN